MFGLFKSSPFIDPELGELRRRGGAWRGTLNLDGTTSVPLAVSGTRAAPDSQALCMARSISSEYPSWRPAIERALLEHYSPYAEAVEAGELEVPASGLPAIEAPSLVWTHTAVEFLRVAPLGGHLTVEIGYRVAWDEEHTLGARFRDGRLVELCGSVLSP